MLTINHNSIVQIPFSITDSANGLLNKRISWSIGNQKNVRLLTKASALPGSSAGVTIANQTAGEVTGTINLFPADFAALPVGDYRTSLWVDSGTADDVCITPTGYEDVRVKATVART